MGKRNVLHPAAGVILILLAACTTPSPEGHRGMPTCAFNIGDSVQPTGGVGARVPELGKSVEGYADKATGGASSIRIETSRDGVVTVTTSKNGVESPPKSCMLPTSTSSISAKPSDSRSWPCSLLSVSEASTAMGQTVFASRPLRPADMKNEAAPQQPTCLYSSTGPLGALLLSVKRDDTADFGIEFGGPWAPGDVHRPVRGLGDRAILEGCATLGVLEGTTFLRLAVQRADCKQAATVLPPIASHVLGRLSAASAPTAPS